MFLRNMYCIVEYRVQSSWFREVLGKKFYPADSRTFFTLAIDSSRPRIYASSNAPGENSSPERATLSGQRICQFFFPAAAIASRIGAFSDSSELQSADSRSESQNSSAASPSASVSIFIFGLVRRSRRILADPQRNFVSSMYSSNRYMRGWSSARIRVLQLQSF